MIGFVRIIYKELYLSKNGVDTYFFHQHYLFSPGQISFFREQASEKGFIEYSDGVLKLSKNGRIYIEEQFENIFYPKNKPWLRIPDHMVNTNDSSKNLPFILYLSHSDQTSFKNYTKYKVHGGR